MAAPLTQTQLPLEAILDIFGKQLYLGNAFILPFNATSIDDTDEDPIAVIVNPAGSGKSLFLFRRGITSDGNDFIVRFYRNPVLNNAGSKTTPLNLRSGSTTTSISNCYLAASITSNGTFVSALPASTAGLTTDLMYVIDQGSSMLVTCEQETSGTTNIYLEMGWYEI